MLKVEDWLVIREQARQGVTISEIARQTGRDPKTIRKVLREGAPQPRRASGRSTNLAPFHEYLRQRLTQGCWNASVLFEEVRDRGYPGQISRLRDFLRPLRQAQRRDEEAAIRFETEPGRQAQVDWGEFGRMFDAATGHWGPVHAFVFTLGYSRALFVQFTSACDLEHFLAGHLAAFEALGIPETVLYDNLKTAILGRQTNGAPIFPGRFLDFALYSGFTPKFCQPYRARTKGKVERSIRYLRQNFWVRVAAEVAAGALSLAGLNQRVADWIAQVAHPRVHGTHREVVAERLARERPQLGSLTARPRYEVNYRTPHRVGRDGRFSYRGQVFQAPIRHALDLVTVQETLDGALRVIAGDGSSVRFTRVAAAPEPGGVQPARGMPAFVPLLVHHQPPEVEVCDLAIYEEVAHGAAR